MNKENSALKLVDEIILYHDAQITATLFIVILFKTEMKTQRFGDRTSSKRCLVHRFRTALSVVERGKAVTVHTR